MTPLPLSGFRVIDCSTQLAAPIAATLLADFGADVIKVELPAGGATGIDDLIRLHEERNKRAMTIDLRRPAGQAILARLCDTADCLVENFRPGTMERWQLGPERLMARNPRSIYYRLSAYGQSGPWREKGGFDRQAQAFAGATHVTGYPDQPPVRSGFALADYMGAYCGAFGILLAAYWRDARGGAGQVVDLALYEPMFRASEASIIRHSVTGQAPRRAGNVNPGVVPSANYLSLDGVWLAINANTDRLFHRLARLIGRADLADHPDYQLPRRRDKGSELYPLIEAWVSERTADTVQAACDGAKIPCSPVLDIAAIAAHPHYRARGSHIEVDGGERGPVRVANAFPFLSATPGRVEGVARPRGLDTNTIMSELGYADADIAALAAEGVIAPLAAGGLP